MMKRTLLSSALLACVALTSATYAQDSNDQSLGDVVRKDQAKAKPKAKVTLDEDNTQPAPQAATETSSDSSSKPDAAAPGTDQTAANQSPQARQPSPQERIQQIDQQENDLKSGLDVLQDKIDHSDSDQQTKDTWRNAVIHGRERLDEMEKEKRALQSQSGAQTSPAPSQQPASNPQQ